MQKLIFLITFSASLAGCASWDGYSLPPGTPAAVVEARLGQPTSIYHEGADTLLEYAKGPAAQYTFMARLDADGRLRSYEQVLTSEKFATVKIGKDDQATILRTFGRPNERHRYPDHHRDTWLYRYKEQGVWDSIMYVEFDEGGIVQAMVNGPDPDRDPGMRRGR